MIMLHLRRNLLDRFLFPPTTALCLVFGCLLLAVPATAEDFECRWANGPIAIDGLATEADWQSAMVIDRFLLPGTNGNQASTLTKARLLWDRERLYFFAEMEDHDLFANVLERDGKTWDNDVFELFFRPDASKPGYYEFQVNAAGTEMDLYLPDQNSGGYEKLKSSHPFQMQSKVVRNGTLDDRKDRDTGWAVEGSVLWVDMLPTGGRPDVGETWTFALCRYDYTGRNQPELSSCAPLTKVDFHRLVDYAKLRFTGPQSRDQRLEQLSQRPSRRNTNVLGSPEPPPPYHHVRAYPKLKPEWPVDVRVEPGSSRLIIIEEKSAYSPTMIRRTSDAPANGETELLLDPQGVAYSLAFHPKFNENGFLYVGSNGQRDGQPHKSRIVRYTLQRQPPYRVVGDPQTIIEWESNGHNGAAVTFGIDGMLYVTSGDGTSDSDGYNSGQDMTRLLAKVLRIDVDHPADGRPYSIPADNPFVNVPDARKETWAIGLRNPWRITTDPKTGHIWVGNNGQDMYEQAYLVERGANYGWSVFEGSHPFYAHRQLAFAPHTLPTVEHPHSEARSLTGGVVYHGLKYEDLRGAYVYGDYSTGKIWAAKHDGKELLWHREIADTPLQISAITLDVDGELLVVDHRGDGQGGLYHLVPTQVESNAPSFPRRLSETGLFQSTEGHSIANGVIPYSVAAPFWSDGAMKYRFMAIPEGQSVEVKDQWAWQFPENSVIVKSFQIETVDGDPNSRKWIETRIMTRQQGEWVGYSYAWRDDQSDAELVEAAGRDHQFSRRFGNEEKAFAWRYPSRTECMVCHTRAAGFLLGLSSVQLNTSHDYGTGGPVNQLVALESMGILKNDWASSQKEKLRKSLESHKSNASTIDEQIAALKPDPAQRAVASTQLLARSPEETPQLADPHDESADVELRARSFLHSNCAYCHVEAGGGNAQIDLSIYVPRDKMRAIDVKPLHHTFGKADARIIAPGDSQRSVLLHRISMRGPGQMPQLATNLVDPQAVGLLKKWIDGLEQ